MRSGAGVCEDRCAVPSPGGGQRGVWSGVAGEESDRHRGQQMLTEAGEPMAQPLSIHCCSLAAPLIMTLIYS